MTTRHVFHLRDDASTSSCCGILQTLSSSGRHWQQCDCADRLSLLRLLIRVSVGPGALGRQDVQKGVAAFWCFVAPLADHRYSAGASACRARVSNQTVTRDDQMHPSMQLSTAVSCISARSESLPASALLADRVEGVRQRDWHADLQASKRRSSAEERARGPVCPTTQCDEEPKLALGCESPGLLGHLLCLSGTSFGDEHSWKAG